MANQRNRDREAEQTRDAIDEERIRGISADDEDFEESDDLDEEDEGDEEDQDAV